MTALTLSARHRSGTPTCSGTVGYRAGWYGPEPVPCRVQRGLRRIGDLWACAKHGEQVERLARRTSGRCRCQSPLRADGRCDNADCGNWRGPR